MGNITLKVGRKAPNFTLVDGNRTKYTLSQYRGRQNVVIAFFILAFTGG